RESYRSRAAACRTRGAASPENVARVRDPSSGILWGDRAEGGPDGGAMVFDGAGSAGAQGGLDLREGFLDRGEVGRVGRQIPELGAARFDRFPGTLAVVDLQIVDDHDLVGLQ